MSSSDLNRTLSDRPVGGNGLHHGLNRSGLSLTYHVGFCRSGFTPAIGSAGVMRTVNPAAWVKPLHLDTGLVPSLTNQPDEGIALHLHCAFPAKALGALAAYGWAATTACARAENQSATGFFSPSAFSPETTTSALRTAPSQPGCTVSPSGFAAVGLGT
jgi:hypothetical protein